MKEIYSSTLIRKYLKNGQPQRAAALLGHLWDVEGRVREGRQLGRTIGFPTANVDLGDAIRPALRRLLDPRRRARWRWPHPLV